jgi:hypothetical protein
VAGIHQMGRVQFYTQALYELTMRQGLDEGLSGDALAQRVADLRTNPTADMTARARDVADTSMFQRKTQFGTYQAGLARWTDSHVMAKLMFPFTKIAFEQIRESIVKRTPLAFGSQEMRNQLLMRGSGAAFDEAWGKVIFGTGLLGGGLLWAASGGITGAGPTDPKKRSEWLLNNQPNSMTIGNLQVPIAGLGYPSKLLQLAADLWETREFTKDDDLGKAAVAYMQATLRTVLDEGFFRDVANLNDAIHDPGRNAPRYLNSIALGAIPYSSFLGQANRHILDPYSKEVEPGLAGMFQDLRARMPVTSWDIPNRPDMFGEPIPSRGVNFNRYAGDPTAQWLAQIGVGPGRLDRSMAGGVRLTEDQFHNLEQRSGQLSKQLLDAMRDSTRQLPLGMQLKMIDSLIGTARHSARIELGIQSVGSDNDIWAKAQELKLRKFQ